MRRLILMVSLFGLLYTVSPAHAGACPGCTEIKKKGEGFCDHCSRGKVFGLGLASHKLYDELAGDTAKFAKLSKSPCGGCKKAAKSNGACEHCNVYVANGAVYRTKAAQALAMGLKVDDPKVTKALTHCSGCAKLARSKGYCSGCDAGFVAGRAYKAKAVYDAAVSAYELVRRAIKEASQCEACAIARVSDGSCKGCNIKFKDGKPIS